jgi:hypothetical protein
MARPFDVVIGHAGSVHPRDRFAIDEQLRRHQHAVDQHRVIGRQIQIARRRGGPERAGGDAHRPDRFRFRIPRAVYRSATDPDDRLRLAIMGQRDVASPRQFHPDGIAVELDQCGRLESSTARDLSRFVPRTLGSTADDGGL